MKMNNEIKQIYEVLLQDGGFINNHNNVFEVLGDSIKLGLLVKGEEQYIVPIYARCCLNPIRISKRDGKPHLSQYSIGGTIIGFDVDTYNENVWSEVEKLYLIEDII